MSHTFQCPWHSPALGLWPGRALSPEKGRVSRKENPQGKPVAGRRGLQRVGPGPREQREKREEGSGVRGVCVEVARASGLGGRIQGSLGDA